MGKQIFNIKGMMRDLDPAKSPNQYAYEIRNLRLTAQEDTTMLALVSEKGNLQYIIKDITGTANYSIVGNIVGYCTVGTDYLVLFTHDGANPSTGDHIYRLQELSSTTLSCECLYGEEVSGLVKDLGFTLSTNIEAIGIYENEEVQKVYWIDGVHQPRVINIMGNIAKWDAMTICPFDFMLEMQLEEVTSIKKVSNIFGIFPAGTIQYVLSYYNKNSQNTPAFYVSPLYYTTIGSNAVSPEDSASCAFKIEVNNIDTNFEYLSIYSIFRTSLNGTPICKKVTSLRLEDYAGASLSYTDNGLSGETVDYSEILYLGGSNIVPYTMSHKSNTLFFGNIKTNDFIVDDEDVIDIKSGTSIDFTYRYDTSLEIARDINVYYPYKNQLDKDGSLITTFKFGESYYFGIIAQNKYGQWSNVIRLTDTRIQNPYPPRNATLRTQVITPVVRINFTSSVLALLNSLGCKKLKVVRLDETPQIACQGVLCPTIFGKNRVDGGLDYAQSSWYFRPIRYDPSVNYIGNDRNQYYHNENIMTVLDYDCNEIQGASETSLLFDSCVPAQLSDMDMFVDWNMLTLHSPDIEFGDENEFENIEKIRIVGVVPVSYGITSMFVDFDTPPHSATGMVDTTIYSNSQYFDGTAPVRLSKFCYLDDLYNSNDTWGNLVWHMVFPWHRSSTLGSQTTPTTDDEWWGRVGSKCMATLRGSLKSVYIPDSIDMVDHADYTIDITPFKCCDLLNTTVRIPDDPNYTNSGGQRIYSGTVDKVLQGSMSSYYKESLDDYTEYTAGTEDSMIRMSYKSSAHGVFSIMYGDNGIQPILPHTTDQNNGRYNTRSRSQTNYPVNLTPKVIVTSFNDTTNIVYGSHNGNSTYTITSAGYSTGASHPDRVLIKKSYAHTFEPSGLFEEDTVILQNENDLNNTQELVVYSLLFRVLSNSEFNAVAEADPTTYGSYSTSQWYCLEPVWGWTNNSLGTAWTGYNKDFYRDNCTYPPLVYDGRIVVGGNNVDVYYCYLYVYVRNGTPLYNYYSEEKAIVYRVEVQTFTDHAPRMHWHFERITDFPWSSTATFQEIDGIDLPTFAEGLDYLYLADLVRNDRGEITNFVGTNWLVSGIAYDVPSGGVTSIIGEIGDTYYQRYDCLKTIPYSSSSQNQIVDILSFMCETRINLDGRYDEMRGNSDNTMVNEQNFNKMNIAYSQKDNFFVPQYLNQDIANITHFPNKILWTKTKIYGSLIDNWTHIVSTSSLDLDGDRGSIKALKTWNDNLICFQDMGIAKIMYNERTTISTQQGVPVEIANSGKVDGSQYISNQIGCSNKNSIQITQDGIYFIDSHTKEIYKWSKGLESLSKSKGFNTYMQKGDVYVDTEKSFYDPKLKDIYFRFNRTNYTECLVYNEQIEEFTSFFDYDMDFLFPFKGSLISVEHNSGNLWKQFANDEYLRYFGEVVTVDNTDYPVYKNYSVELISAENPTITKIFTGMEFRADVLGSSITQSGSQSTESGSLLNLASINKLPFKTMRVWNEYQDTGSTTFERLVRKGANLSQKFRIWRANIARDHNDKDHHFNRIISPWARFRLSGGGEDIKTVIHDIGVMYV